MYSSLDLEAIGNVMTHDFVSFDTGSTILCRVYDRSRFKGDVTGMAHQMFAVTHKCSKCGFEARIDQIPANGYPDCNTVICSMVLDS